ncbi:MAG: hypothetical protein ACYSR4_06605, partial [Planctomycetota bacterium]
NAHFSEIFGGVDFCVGLVILRHIRPCSICKAGQVLVLAFPCRQQYTTVIAARQRAKFVIRARLCLWADFLQKG